MFSLKLGKLAGTAILLLCFALLQWLFRKSQQGLEIANSENITDEDGRSGSTYNFILHLCHVQLKNYIDHPF